MSKIGIDSMTPTANQDHAINNDTIDLDSIKDFDTPKPKCYGKMHFTTKCIKCEERNHYFRGVSSKPDKIPVCFGNYTSEIEYASVFELNCDVCNIRLDCARKTARDD